MQFYTKNHQHYCGIDLHTKMMVVCILNNLGEIVLHQNIPTDPAKFLKLIAPFREDLIIGVEWFFSATAPALLSALVPDSALPRTSLCSYLLHAVVRADRHTSEANTKKKSVCITASFLINNTRRTTS